MENIMNTIKITYNDEQNTSDYYIGGVFIARYYFNTDELEIDCNEQDYDEDDIVNQMYRNREEHYEMVNGIKDHREFINFNFYNLY